MIRKNLPWILFFIFAGLAMVLADGESLFVSEGPYGPGKPLTWLLFIFFLAYTIYCSNKENFIKSMRRLFPILWARQITIDLYLGLLISLFLIYLNEGSLLILLVWLVPILIYANLATLLYVAIHYDSIVAHFVV